MLNDIAAVIWQAFHGGPRMPVQEDLVKDQVRWATTAKCLREAGYSYYLDEPPRRDLVCAFYRDTTGDFFEGRANQFDPLFNVANLWWKPASEFKPIDITPVTVGRFSPHR